MIVEFGAILWFLFDCTFKQGMSLHPPQNVTLTSENFYTFLMWHPAPGSTNDTQYEVEIHNGKRSSPDWIKEASCRGNHLKLIQSCQLHLPDIYTRYYARMRTQDGARSSGWANSNALQLYKDTIIGPLNLSLAVADHDLTVSVSMLQTPLKRNEIIKIMKTLEILVVLYGDNKATQKAKMSYDRMKYTFENIKPNANYCVEAKVIDQPAKEAVQCSKMPFVRADYVWAPYIIVSLVLAVVILLIVVGRALLKHHLHMKSSEIVFPKSLTFLDTNLSTWRSILPLDDVSVTSFSTMYFFSNHCMLEQPERCQIQLIPGGCNSQLLSVYCANGLCWKERESIVLSSIAVDAHLSSQSLEDEYLTDGDSRTALEVLETSVHPPSVTGGLSPQGLIGSWESTCKIGNTSGQLTLSSLFKTDVFLDSLKLPNMLDFQELLQEPYAYISMADSCAYPKAWVQQSTESLVCQEDCGLSSDTEDTLGSNVEGRATDTTKFPGYESRPPILFWKLKF